MDWLSALDANNCGLLEIPEAGDWTDLLARSYHILYDEVLWYRCLVYYVRMLRHLGQHDKANDYEQWSEHVKRTILKTFWPTTALTEPGQGPKFCDVQFELGDARYLVAQVSPFGYSWRCDVYGNIMAYLANLLDKDRAMMTFRFLWGVGVNDPWPVRNLYPAIQRRRSGMARLLYRESAQPAEPLSQRRHLAVYWRAVGALYPQARDDRPGASRAREARATLLDGGRARSGNSTSGTTASPVGRWGRRIRHGPRRASFGRATTWDSILARTIESDGRGPEFGEPIIEPFDDAGGVRRRGVVDARAGDGAQFRLRIADDDAAETFVEHRGVIAGVAGHDDAAAVDHPVIGQEAGGGAFVRAYRKDVEIAIGTVNDGRLLTGGLERLPQIGRDRLRRVARRSKLIL